MTVLANGRPAQPTTWYSAMCLCFELLLTQRSRMSDMKCVRDTMGQGSTRTIFHAVACSSEAFYIQVEFFSRVFGNVLHCCVGTKVCTVHVGHCPPFLAWFLVDEQVRVQAIANLVGCMAHSGTWDVIESAIFGHVWWQAVSYYNGARPIFCPH